LTDVPTSIAEALQYDDAEKSLQFHTATSQGGSGGDGSAIFHGQGGGNNDHKDGLLCYFRKVSNELESFLKNEQAPLILAGVRCCN
jgi:hypothetical protein